MKWKNKKDKCPCGNIKYKSAKWCINCYKGKNRSQWKGDKVGYARLHAWIRQNKPQPHLCDNCELKQSFEIANISGEYKRDINDFEWLCRSCHMKKDGRMKNLKLGGISVKGRKFPNKNINQLRDKFGRFIGEKNYEAIRKEYSIT
ncbi:MAG: hypothetical protein AABY22_28005 [Nanoarchaeota archaeon]